MNRNRIRLCTLAVQQEVTMALATKEVMWQRDFDAALADAQRTGKHVLVDFSAAPM
jgi:hypothetical protein